MTPPVIRRTCVSSMCANMDPPQVSLERRLAPFSLRATRLHREHSTAPSGRLHKMCPVSWSPSWWIPDGPVFFLSSSGQCLSAHETPKAIRLSAMSTVSRASSHTGSRRGFAVMARASCLAHLSAQLLPHHRPSWSEASRRAAVRDLWAFVLMTRGASSLSSIPARTMRQRSALKLLALRSVPGTPIAAASAIAWQSVMYRAPGPLCLRKEMKAVISPRGTVENQPATPPRIDSRHS